MDQGILLSCRLQRGECQYNSPKAPEALPLLIICDILEFDHLFETPPDSLRKYCANLRNFSKRGGGGERVFVKFSEEE